ncbi:hypothetical protein EV193_101902 [Herbihabitans rhizosphaerae]|uniref:Uncharacterized protein n=1 Tax=Herbihabitans rhizosphaerae TaxID=1872711 RepID=A0A4Q7L5T8_9PSEU|nr:hypothetical protein EV193_101902 [Herbihabitans rhizosphaerae]
MPVTGEDVPLACVALQASPTQAADADDEIEFKGADGPQSFAFLDPRFESGASAPDWLLHTMAFATWPYDGGASTCGRTGRVSVAPDHAQLEHVFESCVRVVGWQGSGVRVSRSGLIR